MIIGQSFFHFLRRCEMRECFLPSETHLTREQLLEIFPSIAMLKHQCAGNAKREWGLLEYPNGKLSWGRKNERGEQRENNSV